MDSLFAKIAAALVVVVAIIALAQGKSLKTVLGYDSRLIWSYRDAALIAIAAISALWAVVALGFQSDPFDRKLGVVCAVVAFVACSVSPNRMALYPVPLAFVALQGWWAALYFGDQRGWWIAISSSMLLLAYLKKFGHLPVRS